MQVHKSESEFFDEYSRAKLYVKNKYNFDIDEHHVMNICSTNYKSFEIIYSGLFVTILRGCNYYFLVVYNTGFNHGSRQCSYIYLKSSELSDADEIWKRIKKEASSLVGEIYVRRYEASKGSWNIINSIDRDKYEPLRNEFYKSMTKKLDIMKRLQEKSIAFNSNILLSGPPGCGKTRFVLDIAVYLNYHIYYIDVSSGDLSKLNGQENCIFLFEEIDKYLSPDGSFISTNFNESEILSFMDGIVRHSSTILAMTCNDEERVLSNKILTRENRINTIYRFKGLDFEQCKHILNLYYGTTDEQAQQFFDALPKKNSLTISVVSAYIQNKILNEVPFEDLNPKEVIVENKTKTSQIYY